VVDLPRGVAAASGAVARRTGTTWEFNHALYRDTAYEGLAFSRRRHLHRLAAAIIEDEAADAVSVAPLLSLHYAAAGSHEQAWQHSLVAGASAEAQHATNEAAVAYERALVAGRFCHHLTRADRVRVAEQLGDLYYELGRFDRASRVYGLARRTNDDPVVEVGLVRKIGSVCERQGRPDRAIRWYSRAARAVPAEARDRAWSLARADVGLAEAGIRARRGENERCLQLARLALDDARRAGDERVEALALERIHLAITYLRQPDLEATGPRALDAYRKLDDPSGMARILINLGIEAYFRSDWTAASARCAISSASR
jgi:tetratricopeptide (TPR) repeat protein